jgi:hypothetical protein
MVLNPHPIYPSAGRYVLLLHRDSCGQHGQLFGRIEHVASGASMEFASAADLLDWLTRHAAQACDCEPADRHHPTRKDNP